MFSKSNFLFLISFFSFCIPVQLEDRKKGKEGEGERTK